MFLSIPTVNTTEIHIDIGNLSDLTWNWTWWGLFSETGQQNLNDLSSSPNPAVPLSSTELFSLCSNFTKLCEFQAGFYQQQHTHTHTHTWLVLGNLEVVQLQPKASIGDFIIPLMCVSVLKPFLAQSGVNSRAAETMSAGTCFDLWNRPYQTDYGRKYLTWWQTKENRVLRAVTRPAPNLSLFSLRLCCVRSERNVGWIQVMFSFCWTEWGSCS